jgi:hypothetical protein
MWKMWKNEKSKDVVRWAIGRPKTRRCGSDRALTNSRNPKVLGILRKVCLSLCVGMFRAWFNRVRVLSIGLRPEPSIAGWLAVSSIRIRPGTHFQDREPCLKNAFPATWMLLIFGRSYTICISAQFLEAVLSRFRHSHLILHDKIPLLRPVVFLSSRVSRFNRVSIFCKLVDPTCEKLGISTIVVCIEGRVFLHHDCRYDALFWNCVMEVGYCLKSYVLKLWLVGISSGSSTMYAYHRFRVWWSKIVCPWLCWQLFCSWTGASNVKSDQISKE